jgi:hypothetical protein
MSLPTDRQAYAFLEPLRGRSAIFLIKSRESNVAISRFILGCLAVSRMRATVFDSSCFYSVNIRRLTSGLPKEFLQQSTLLVPTDDSGYEDSLTEMAASDASAVLVDDLNAVLHLLSAQSQKSGIHRLSTFFQILSYSARVNKLLVLGVAYRTESVTAPTKSTKRSLPKISDLQIATDVGVDEIVFHCDAAKAWPAEGFRAPVYFDPST